MVERVYTFGFGMAYTPAGLEQLEQDYAQAIRNTYPPRTDLKSRIKNQFSKDNLLLNAKTCPGPVKKKTKKTEIRHIGVMYRLCDSKKWNTNHLREDLGYWRYTELGVTELLSGEGNYRICKKCIKAIWRREDPYHRMSKKTRDKYFEKKLGKKRRP